MTSELGLKLQEAVERAEARKAMAQWEQPTITKPAEHISLAEALFNLVRDNPGKTKTQIADLMAKAGYKHTSVWAMLNTKIRDGMFMQNADKTLHAVGDTYKPYLEFTGQQPKKPGRKVTKKKEVRMIRRPIEVASDPVNHPSHYKVGGIETIDFIEAKQLSFNLGNVVKYITRAEHKGNQLQDLQKAQWYLAREIDRVQA